MIAPTRVSSDDGVWVAPTAVDGEDDRRDSTVLILRALARHPEAATRVLIDADLDCLLGEVWYRDGGAALGEVLRAGTDPTGSPAAPHAALEVIGWVAARTRLDGHGVFRSGPTMAPLAADALGRVAAPYIGSFRSDRNDGIDVDPASDLLARALSDEQVLQFLMAASQRQVARDDLGIAVVNWAAAAVERRAGDGRAIGYLAAVADVARTVAWATHEGDISQGRTDDQLRRDERAQWGFVQSVVGVVVDRIDPTSFVMSAGSNKVIDHFLPESSHQFDAAHEASWTLPQQQLQLEQIVLAAQNPYVDRYHASLAQVEMAIATSIANNKELTDTDRTNITQLISQAINEGKATVTLNQGRSGNWEILAQIYGNIMPFAQGADQFAIQTYTQAVALDPINPNLRIALGGIYYSLGRYDEAIDSFKLAIMTKPDYANSHYNLAIAYREKKDYDNAIAQMNTVLTLVTKDSPDYTLAQTTLADLEKSKPAAAKSTGTENLTPPQKQETIIKPPIELPKEATPPATQ